MEELNNLSKRATLVSLTIKSWGARCIDKQVSEDVLYQHNAASNAGRFSKRLIEKDAIKDINSIVSEIRNYYRDKTLAWEDGKTRLLPVSLTTEFMDKMRDFELKFDDAVDNFIIQYPSYKDEARETLNGLYNEADYPDVSEIKDKFSLKYSFANISDPNDFRCEVSEEIKDRIQNSMKESMNEQYQFSIKKLYEKIYLVIKKFNEKLSGDGERFHKTLVGNIQDLVDILPDLNFMNNEKINEMIVQIKEQLCNYNVEDLKTDKEIRQTAIERSNALLSTIESIYA